MARPVIALAGITGDLGERIARALVARGADVRALVRPGLEGEKQARIEALGISAIAADPASIDAMREACAGAARVVSALNGARDAVIERRACCSL